MKRDLTIKPMDFKSSFLSCEKDCETILRRLFVESQPYSNELKRLLVLNTPDCLDNKTSKVYNDIIANTTLASLRKDGYIKLEPKLRMFDHEEIKTYIIITFDNFVPNANNPKFRDCTISFDILCHTDYWDIGNFRLRPFKIAGYIDGILDESRLSGIGKLEFAGCNELVLDENLSGYTLLYRAVHGSDDVIDTKPEQKTWLS